MKLSAGLALALRGLIVSLAALFAGPLAAQSFTNLHNFAGIPGDGSNPLAGMIASGNRLYGTTVGGGNSGQGTVFAVNTDSTGFAILHQFTGVSDGSFPSYGGLALSGGALFGTTSGGGSSGNGTVFRINTDGSGFAVLHAFAALANSTNGDGAEPTGALILSGSTLYGTAHRGGASGGGTVFAISTNGAGFTTLFNFSDATGGSNPYAGLVLSGSTLYGTTYGGLGPSTNGSVFALNMEGTVFATLHTFTPTTPDAVSSAPVNGDGANPYAGLVLSGNTLYGAAYYGGSAGRGTLFAVNTDGTGFSVLHSFAAFDQTYSTNADGGNPAGRLISAGVALYGTAAHGGPFANGTAFTINLDGTGFGTLHGFTQLVQGINGDGSNPQGGLVFSGNNLFGTASTGGNSGNHGTVFGISRPPLSPPALTIAPTGATVNLTWPAGAAGFTLQSSTNVGPPAAWSNVSPGPTVIDGQNTVTIPVSGFGNFYRLIQ